MTSILRIGICAVPLLSVCGCLSPGYDGPQGLEAIGDPAVGVPARVETIVTTDSAVDADDPALWADADDPSRALLFATDKTDGLYVHDLDGTVRQFLPSGQLNNVDLRTGYSIGGRDSVLVGATNDTPGRMGINLYLLDTQTLETADYAFIETSIGEPYGFCMGRFDDEMFLVVTTKAGTAHQWTVEHGADGPVTGPERRLVLQTQLEGCVSDDEAGVLYVGEEDAAIWQFSADPAGSVDAALVAEVDYVRIKDDIEGLTIMRDGDRSYLIASSQGDSTFPVFAIENGGTRYVGRFTVTANGDIDEVTHTDGLDAWSGPIGVYPEGLLAIHDDFDTPGTTQQNYKLVDWRDVRIALNLGSE